MTKNPCSPICEKCNDTGWVLINDGMDAIECECGAYQRKIQQNKLQFASIPHMYQDVTLADFKTKYYSADKKEQAREVAEVVQYWIENMEELTRQGKGLYFWSGTKGSGKTMLTVAIANELMKNHMRSVKFATSLDILDAIRNTYNRDNDESENKLLDDLARAEYLIIDDFGTERVTDWAGEKFYQIVNKRYLNNKVTFYTSNYDLLKLDYDARITNRIRERSFIVHFPEESVREVKARQENNFDRLKQ